MSLGGRKIQRVRDAEARSGNFEPYDLPAQKLELSILPVWLFSDRRLLNERIAARTYLAAHIPAKD
jgi:hypothetical protein